MVRLGSDPSGRIPLSALRRVRIAQGMSIARLAGLAGISPPTVTRIEQGNFAPTTLRTVLALAIVLQTAPVDLFPMLKRIPMHPPASLRRKNLPNKWHPPIREEDARAGQLEPDEEP